MNIENIPPEEDFAELFAQQTFETTRRGMEITGIVVSVSDAAAELDIKGPYTAILPAEEYSFNPNEKITNLRIGDEITVKVTGVRDSDGVADVSLKELQKITKRKEFEDSVGKGTYFTGKITRVRDNGVIFSYLGIEMFAPTQKINDYLGHPAKGGENVEFILSKVIDENGRKKYWTRFGSAEESRKREERRSAYEARIASEDKFWERVTSGEITVGKTVKGTVRAFSYKRDPNTREATDTVIGAFVDLGGFDGRIPSYEASWGSEKIDDLIKIGDEIDVLVTDIDNGAEGAENARRKISLSLRQLKEKPIETFKATYKIGDEIDVTIASFTSFGAFAHTPIAGVDGLIHISELANHRIELPSEAVSIGDIVKVKIINIFDIVDKRGRPATKISLSIKALLDSFDSPTEETQDNISPEIQDAADIVSAVSE